MSVKTRLQRKREQESLKQSGKYLLLIFLTLFLLVRFGLPALVKMATFIGDLRSSNEPIEQQDTIAPLPPRLNPLPEATTSAEISIAGYGESGTTIQLFLRGISLEEKVVNNEGEFKFDRIHLREGENEIYVKARDDQGNTSEPSSNWTVTVDNTAPTLTLESPSNGDRFFDNDSPITVKGVSEAGVNIRINGRLIIADSDGSFETKLPLNSGDNTIEVIATDRAGNEAKQVLTVNYTK